MSARINTLSDIRENATSARHILCLCFRLIREAAQGEFRPGYYLHLLTLPLENVASHDPITSRLPHHILLVYGCRDEGVTSA